MPRHIRSFPVRLALLASLLAVAGAGRAADPPGNGGEPATEPYTVLISGANRGIGYELARQYAAMGWRVIATAREPAEAEELNALAARHATVSVEQLDVTDQTSVDALAEKYRGTPVDVLLNNAGILGDTDRQRLDNFDLAVFDEVLDVNVKGPLRLVAAFIDHVAASRQKKIMNMSSAVGSIQLTFGGQVFYRTSKAALNMSMRTLSKEIRRDPKLDRREVIFGLINPGVVDTGFAKNVPIPMIQADESAAGVIAIIDGFTLEKSGSFFDYKGAELPW